MIAIRIFTRNPLFWIAIIDHDLIICTNPLETYHKTPWIRCAPVPPVRRGRSPRRRRAASFPAWPRRSLAVSGPTPTSPSSMLVETALALLDVRTPQARRAVPRVGRRWPHLHSSSISHGVGDGTPELAPVILRLLLRRRAVDSFVSFVAKHARESRIADHLFALTIIQ